MQTCDLFYLACRRIIVCHGKTLLGAGVHARAALDALHPVDLPDFFRLFDRNRMGRALFLAQRAENAGADSIDNVAAGVCVRYSLNKGIEACHVL